jgi:hypothetical protein
MAYSLAVPRRRISAVAFFFCTAPVFADVTVTRVTRSDGFRGMGAFESEFAVHYKGPNKREESNTKFKGAVMGRLAGGQRITIVRVEDDKVVMLDPKRKTYNETTITRAAEEMEKAKKQAEGRREESRGKESKPTHRVTKTEYKVTPTGEKKTINTYPCERYRVTMLVETENIETKQKSESRMEADYWNTAPDAALKSLEQEAMSFEKAYMKKLGVNVSPEEAQKFGLAAIAAGMGASEDQLKPKLAALQKETAKMKGTPIVTEVKWFMESEEVEAARRQAETEQAAQEKEEKDDGVDLSGGASGVLGGFAGKMAKKKMQGSAEKRAAERGGKPVFSSYDEIREVKVAEIPAALFEVPAGYKPEK